MRGLREGWTKHPWEWLLLLAAVAMLVTLAVAPRADGAFHFMKIRQVHPENGAGDWVELQMYESGQTFVQGHYVQTYFGDGSVNTTYQIANNVLNGQTQRTILIGNGATVGGGVAVDLNAGTNLELIGGDGAVCFIDTLGPPTVVGIDCVTYGAYTGPALSSPTGTPATATQFGETLARTIAPNCPTLLEDADDTNNSATDFALSVNPPRNNATVPTETACQPPVTPPVITPVITPLTPTPVAPKKCKKGFKLKKGKCKRKKKRKK